MTRRELAQALYKGDFSTISTCGAGIISKSARIQAVFGLSSSKSVRFAGEFALISMGLSGKKSLQRVPA